MAFQPILDASSRKVFGYEALLRSEEPSQDLLDDHLFDSATTLSSIAKRVVLEIT